MESKKFYDYETESKDKLTSPRMHFRNMNTVSGVMGFPFRLITYGGLYDEPYDVYQYGDSKIFIVGGDAHCHVEGELGKYEEGIVFRCDKKDKEEIIKQIRKVR